MDSSTDEAARIKRGLFIGGNYSNILLRRKRKMSAAFLKERGGS